MPNKKKIKEEVVKDTIVKEIIAINNGKVGDVQLRPNLALLMIGNNESSGESIKALERESIRVGVDVHTYICPVDSDMEEIEAMVECLNDDELIDGIYLERPLPEVFVEDEVLSLISAEKDLSYLVENKNQDQKDKEAKLFRAVLDLFKEKQDKKEEL
jgi:methylenetetrahydrofolate dehydrogenase (NADP+)/methenyltetrahydrofolate cyclohydrolase